MNIDFLNIKKFLQDVYHRVYGEFYGYDIREIRADSEAVTFKWAHYDDPPCGGFSRESYYGEHSRKRILHSELPTENDYDEKVSLLVQKIKDENEKKQAIYLEAAQLTAELKNTSPALSLAKLGYTISVAPLFAITYLSTL